MYGITPFEPRRKAVLEAFKEALDFIGLRYGSHALSRYGFHDEESRSAAIRRALCVCKCMGLNPKSHFSYYYKVDMVARQVSREWRMSKMGFYLVLCNGDPGNPYAAAFQMEMIRELLDRLD